MSRPTDPEDHSTDDGADARIDAMARDAGNQLRRPAPVDGPARAQRTRRNKASVRAALAITAAVAVMAVGAVVLTSRDKQTGLVPAISVATTEPTTSSLPTTAAPSSSAVPTTTTAAPSSTESPTTTAATSTLGAPSVVYTTTGPVTDPGLVMTLVDPVSGAPTGTDVADVDRSSAAQVALPGRPRSNVDLGAVAYAFDQVFYDAGTLDTTFYPDVDLCGQNVVTVRSAAGSALPTRAHVLSVSPDDRYVVTLSSRCPEAGTMGADGVGTQLPFEATFQVFDAQHPDVPGRTLLTGVAARNVASATYSANGRFVALEVYDDKHEYLVFDLETGEQITFGDGCSVSGGNYSRFIGPWIGQSSIALMLQCADGQRLVVRDLMPGGEELTVPAGGPDASTGIRAEVDYAHFDSPANTWFILCDLSQQLCRVGQGNGPLVTLTGVSDASFLPLGYTPGG